MAPAPVRTPPPRSIGDRAADDLRFIRQAMERGATFTAVPGVGGAVMGLIGLMASFVGAFQHTPQEWLAVWLSAAVVAFLVGVAGIWRKAARAGAPLTGNVARSFAVAVSAPIAAGAGITYALWSTSTYTAMPTVWLLLYGAGVLAGGAFSVLTVRIVGGVFMFLGFLAALTPPAFGNVWLGVGFGAVQLAGGLYIARHHGG
jgi:hypothetical protein